MTHPTPSPRILLLAAGHPDREELARVLSDAGTVIRGASSEPPDLVVAAGPAEGAADEERAGASRGRELSPIPVLR